MELRAEHRRAIEIPWNACRNSCRRGMLMANLKCCLLEMGEPSDLYIVSESKEVLQ